MGYKLAGCDVIGCCEIDPKMNEIYVKNHKPKYNYLMDIRDFNEIPTEELPADLFTLDILDGSPPCTTFSMAGEREDGWGKKKKFREGQAEQTLDDLSFVFIDTVNKLKPKTVIMENVEGLLLGAAWSYVQRIYKKLMDIGYKVNHYLLKGEHMGIPQRRHRVFFIAVRNDIDFCFDNLDMVFDYEPVTYKTIKEGKLKPLDRNTKYGQMAILSTASDNDVEDTCKRLGKKATGFNNYYIRDNQVMPTIATRSIGSFIDTQEIARPSTQTIRNAQTFPQDYDFINNHRSNIGYVCGMSVPPVMIKRIANRLIESGIFEKRS